jgi:WD40 repeat protein
MATPGAEFSTLRRKVSTPLNSLSPAETELESGIQDLEKKIANHRDIPLSDLLQEVVERTQFLTGADGTAIAISDQWGVTCRASVGQAPERGSRLRPDSALTRECFETAQIVICEDTETDYRVRRSTAKGLSLRSAVVVPLQARSSVLGVIEVLSSQPFAFKATQIAGLQRVAERLADVLGAETMLSELAAAEADKPLSDDVKSAAPVLVQVLRPQIRKERINEEPVLAALPVAALARERKYGLKTVLLWVTALLLLSLLYFAFVRALDRNRQRQLPSSPAATGASTPPPSTRPAFSKPEGGAIAIPPVAADPSQHSAAPAHPSTSAPSRDSQPGARTAAVLPATPTEKPAEKSTVESQPTESNRPVLPALVIQGMPPGTQVFLDDQPFASANSSGQTSISTLADGVHHLRLKLNGYRDYDQNLDIQSGKTSTVTAKLEPMEMPVLTVRPKAPVLELAPAIPAPLTSTRLSPPNFALERTLKAHSGWVTTIAFSADGQRLASGSWDRTVKFWEVASGEKLSTVTSNMKEVQSLVFSRDGHWLATENSANTAVLRDANTGQEIRALPSNKALGALGSNWVYSIAFSPDGRWLASGVDDKTVRLWDVKTGEKVRDFTGLRRAVIYIAFSPDGRRLATGDDEKSIRIWDTASGEPGYKLSGHKKAVYAAVFSPDGRWLASASADKTIKLWDVATGRARTLTGHGNIVTSIAFSPDGRYLVSGSWDKTVKIWEVETGREVQTLAGHDHPIYSVAFDSRGGWLASGSEDGVIKLWRLDKTPSQIGSRQ